MIKMKGTPCLILIICRLSKQISATSVNKVGETGTELTTRKPSSTIISHSQNTSTYHVIIQMTSDVRFWNLHSTAKRQDVEQSLNLFSK